MHFRANRPNAGFTLIELMISVAIVGILAAVAIPAFVRYTKKAKAAEVPPLLRKMMEGARTYYLDTHKSGGISDVATSRRFPDTVGRTPAASCCDSGGKCPGSHSHNEWEQPTWTALLFSVKDSHFYRYSFTSTNGPSGSTFLAQAEGDLDCDGDLSSHTLYGEGGPEDVRTAADIVTQNALE